MKTLLAFLMALFLFNPIIAEESNNSQDEISLPVSPQQKVYSRYQTNFLYQHDRGFYFNAVLGPQWNHSLQEPNAKAIRFGSKLGVGGYVADGVAIFGAAWGQFLEEASLVAVGPGVALLFDRPNIGLDFSLGIGRAFNAFNSEDYREFSETVMAANLGVAKYWWLSGRNSLGVALNSGIYGLTLSKGSIGTFGWTLGLGLSFLWG